MDSAGDAGKLFIGGISWETTEEKMRDYFSAFGELTQAVIMKDRATGRARGFGFVVFADPRIADIVVQEKHSIDGKLVEAKKAVPRDEQQNTPRSINGGLPAMNHTRTKKIFVGGLASSVTEEEFRKYFEQFGTITDVVVMYDHGTQRPRGFGFITYDSEEAVDRVLQKSFHELKEKMVEVKRAIPKEFFVGSQRSGGAAYSVPFKEPNGSSLNLGSPAEFYGTQIDPRHVYPPGSRYSVHLPAGYQGSGNLDTIANINKYYGGGATFNSNNNNGGLQNNIPFNLGRSGNPLNGCMSSAIYGNSIPGRNLWSDHNSIGFNNFSPSGVYDRSSYGGSGIWGSTPSPSRTPDSGSSGFSYGSTAGAFGSRAAAYAGINKGFRSPFSEDIPLKSSGLGSSSYSSFFADFYGSIENMESVRKFGGSDTSNLANVRSGICNLDGITAAAGYSAGR